MTFDDLLNEGIIFESGKVRTLEQLADAVNAMVKWCEQDLHHDASDIRLDIDSLPMNIVLRRNLDSDKVEPIIIIRQGY